jgi:DNA-directed RNA polymerase subunit RPC12/RpoP
MTPDIECPYCGSGQYSGNGYEENEIHLKECCNCGKTFGYTTTMLLYYDAIKTDCLNGDAEHDFCLTHTHPEELSKMRCLICGEERNLTASERQKFGIGTIKDYLKALNREKRKH